MMVNDFVCANCGKETHSETRWVDEDFEVRGEIVRVHTEVCFCTHCGSDLFDAELDDRTLERAYSEYRQRHGILSPSEVQDIRNQYGLSQRSLSQLLGWGQITIHRYEAGALPSEAHNQVLRSLRDPVKVRELLEEHPGRLSQATEERLHSRIQSLLAESTGDRIAGEIKKALEDQPVSEFSGYRRFDVDRLGQMVVFFATKVHGVFKTKVMKLLWYSDFLHFRENSISISGAAYAHLPNGPALEHWQALLAALAESKLIQLRSDFGPAWEGERIVPLAEPDLSEFDEAELAILNKVAERLGSKSTKELSDMSHNESAYAETLSGGLISYSFAPELAITLD